MPRQIPVRWLPRDLGPGQQCPGPLPRPSPGVPRSVRQCSSQRNINHMVTNLQDSAHNSGHRRKTLNWKWQGGYVPKARTVSRMAHVPPHKFPFSACPGRSPQIPRSSQQKLGLPVNWKRQGGYVPKATTVSREGPRTPPEISIFGRPGTIPGNPPTRPLDCNHPTLRG